MSIRGGDLPGRGGHFILQDHGQDVWFRHLRLREIPAKEKITPDPTFLPQPVPPAAQEHKHETTAARSGGRLL